MVEWDGLENRRPGNRSVGSNPTLSAKFVFERLLPGDAILDVAASGALNYVFRLS